MIVLSYMIAGRVAGIALAVVVRESLSIRIYKKAAYQLKLTELLKRTIKVELIIMHLFFVITVLITPRYRYNHIPDGTFGSRQDDGSWSGLIGAVARKVRRQTVQDF